MTRKVSICIPAYEYPEGLRMTLESVFVQDLDDFEVIITDDSKSDVLQHVVSDFPRGKIIYRKNAVRLGTPGNWNGSVSAATGQYIKILHHDDWFTCSDSLRQFVKMLDDNPSADLAFSGSMQVSGNSSTPRAITKQQAAAIAADPDILFTGNYIGCPSAVIFRRARMREFDKNLKWLVDLELYIRMLRANKNFVYTEKPLVSIGVSSSQVTNSCISDRELNICEYSYVYKKLGLRENKACRRHLQKVLSSGDPLPVRLIKRLFFGALK